MNNITLRVPNISCGHCVHTIMTELGELEGVQAVEANEGTKLVTVTFDAPASQEKIEKVLADIEYPAEKLVSL